MNKPAVCKSWTEILGKMMTKEQLMTMWYHRQDFSAEYTAVLKDAILNQYGISEDELNSLPEPEQYMKIQTGTRDLFLATLEHQGFDYDITDENGLYDFDGTSKEEGYIDFSFQNNDFCARAYNEWDYVTIWKYGRGSKVPVPSRTTIPLRTGEDEFG